MTDTMAFLLITAAPGAVRARGRAVFGNEQDMVAAAAQAISAGLLCGCFKEPLIRRPGKKAARREAAKQLREQAVAAAMAEWRALGLEP